MRAWSDAEILQGLKEPSKRSDAFHALVKQYSGKLLGFLQKKCNGDREQAEDLLGTVLTKAYRGLMEMSRPCPSLPAWLYRVATNTAYDEFRKADPEDPLYDPLPLDEELLEAAASGPAERTTTQQARDEALAEVLDQLGAENPRYRTLIEMEYLGSCSRDEISEATDIERTQLAQYLKRAKERLLKLARANPVVAAWEHELDQRA